LHYERGEYLLSEMKQYIADLLLSRIRRIGLTAEGAAERWNKVALRCYERCQHFSPPSPQPLPFTLSDILSRGITSFYPTPRHVLLNEHSYMIARLCCSILRIQITGCSVCMSMSFLLCPEFSAHEHRNVCVGLLIGSETRITERRAMTEHCPLSAYVKYVWRFES
jgi:hypothetical protein